MNEIKTRGRGSGRGLVRVSGEHAGSPQQAGSPLHRVVQWFKTMTTNDYMRGVKNRGWPRFNGKLWQRNYWEHIIRDDNEYQRVTEYIINNPMKWDVDQLNEGDGTKIMETQSPCNDERWMV